MKDSGVPMAQCNPFAASPSVDGLMIALQQGLQSPRPAVFYIWKAYLFMECVIHFVILLEMS